MSSSRHSSSRNSGSSVGESTAWQDKLEGACREFGMTTPVFQIVSDRRGKPSFPPAIPSPRASTPKPAPFAALFPPAPPTNGHHWIRSEAPALSTVGCVARDKTVQTAADGIVSGGRTAWSSRVTISGQTVAARFWYDGKNLNNAKEDAAEMALGWIQASASAVTSSTSSPSSSRNAAW